ncbi:intersectin [Acrasis kona]|uniref:Intersectin n=1 Tax=Acrasis kona TaxID=1008807 RepID=A0AAW2ZKQ5_9EUKA
MPHYIEVPSDMYIKGILSNEHIKSDVKYCFQKLQTKNTQTTNMSIVPMLSSILPPLLKNGVNTIFANPRLIVYPNLPPNIPLSSLIAEINTCVGAIPPTWVIWIPVPVVTAFTFPLLHQTSLKLTKATCVDAVGVPYSVFLEIHNSTYIIHSIVQGGAVFSYGMPIHALLWVEGRYATNVSFMPRIVTKITPYSVAMCMKTIYVLSNKWVAPNPQMIPPVPQFGGTVLTRNFACGHSNYIFFVEMGLGVTYLLEVRREKARMSRRVFLLRTKLVSM